MDINQLLEAIREHKPEFIDFRFSDISSNWLHYTLGVKQAMDIMESGIAFDGSSISGWRQINNSDMLMRPDFASYFIDPFASYPTMVIICNIQVPGENNGYIKDPRSIAIKAEQFLKDSMLADTAYFGPEPEFFVFDNIEYAVGSSHSYFKIDSDEFSSNNGKYMPNGNLGGRAKAKSTYLLSQPQDKGSDMRSEMMSMLKTLGIEPTLHHHEVSPAQYEIGFKFDELVKTADNIQKFKYVVKNVAASYGKSATFMPKPIFGENGSGMHVHQSLWKDGINLFDGNAYANLSETALYYIGGIIKHGQSLNAFTNPSTNSYKRLVPGYEAPTHLAYSACNRSASIRIPFSNCAAARRIETRFPDPSANPYLAMSAMLMAGIDGILNKIDPGKAIEDNIYTMSKEQKKDIPTLADGLDCAITALQNDHNYLTNGHVFTDEFINEYIVAKEQEIEQLRKLPHPIEFENSY